MSADKFSTVTWTLSSPSSIPKFGNSDDASLWTKVSKQRLEELANMGVAPCVRIDGGEPLFFKRDIVDWVNKHLIKIQEGKDIPIHFHVHLQKGVDIETTPPEIANLPGLSEWKDVVPKACIYFLVHESKIVYVGQSLVLGFRITQHRDKKLFDRVFFLPVPPDQLDEIEKKFIQLLKPPLNTTHVPVEALTKRV